MSILSFRKDEILRKKKLIDRLFAEGSSFYIYPFKVFYLAVPPDMPSPVQVIISVGKRSFKLATDRNRIRRQIREAYRQHKQELYNQLVLKDIQCLLAIIYTANVHIPSAEQDVKIKAVLKRLNNEINRKLNNPSPSLSDK
jgi:ribonuclease P protein component